MCSIKHCSVSASLAAAGQIYRNDESACAAKRPRSEVHRTHKCNEVVNWSRDFKPWCSSFTPTHDWTQIKYHNLQQLYNDFIMAIFFLWQSTSYTVKSLWSSDFSIPLCEEVPRENPPRHRLNVQTPHRKAWNALKATTFFLWGDSPNHSATMLLRTEHYAHHPD